MVFDLSSWKQSFETISRELKLAKKKKQALDELLAKGRMSQPTFEHLAESLTDNIREFESHQITLAQNMSNRAGELESQIQFLEQFLASLEIHRIGHSISEESYIQNKNVFRMGLDATETELNLIKSSLKDLAPPKIEY